MQIICTSTRMSDTDRGFLVSDLNADGYFETGVVLKNAGLASDMRFDYII